MSHDCEAYRDAWLSAALDRNQEASAELSCGACLRWSQQTARQVSALTALPALSLPDTYAEQGLLEESLGASTSTATAELDENIEVALLDLAHLDAPKALDEFVLQRLSSAQPKGAAMAMGEIEAQHVPSVLDRLVDEEISAPLTHQASRVMGRLERLAAPPELDSRVELELAQGSAPRARMGWTGWVSFMAACLVGWVTVRNFKTPDSKPMRRLTIVHATSLAELSPLAQVHMEALGGRMRPLRAAQEREQR